MSRLTRRTFVKAAAASTLFPAFTVAGTKSSPKVLGANERIRVAVAGINGRGKNHISSFAKLEGVEVACLIDPDSRLFESRAQYVESQGGNRPRVVQDVRVALDDPELNVISIATPNHWHTLMSVWACQAGKDVYVEKPLSHTVREGRVLVEIAKRYGRVVQHGTQSRGSSGHARRAAEIAEGRHGKLLVSRGTCFKRRNSIGFKEPSPPPRGVDFDLWLGPAPEQPHHANLVHYNWHWFWDFGNGDVGNQGVHQMDIARWMIPGATLPKSVVSLGGRFGYKDQGETPNTLVTIFDYGESLLLFEVRGLPTEGGVGNDQTFDRQSSASPRPIAGRGWYLRQFHHLRAKSHPRATRRARP
jgi:predicted dehydrogenase